jgi:hypothetical protein
MRKEIIYVGNCPAGKSINEHEFEDFQRGNCFYNGNIGFKMPVKDEFRISDFSSLYWLVDGGDLDSIGTASDFNEEKKALIFIDRQHAGEFTFKHKVPGRLKSGADCRIKLDGVGRTLETWPDWCSLGNIICRDIDRYIRRDLLKEEIKGYKSAFLNY